MAYQNKTDFHQSLGSKLRVLRKSAGYSQQTVSDFFKCSQDTVSQIETGKRTLDAYELLEYAKFYQKPVTFFFMDSRLD